MSKVGVIVDGPGDYNSLRTRFLGTCKILKTDGPRGESASIRDIVMSSAKQVAMLEDCGCKTVIVLMDFEMRTQDYRQFVSGLAGEFGREYQRTHVIPAVPNRMIENWYLADIAFLSSRKAFLKRIATQRIYEGKNGKEEIKKCFVKGSTYSETIHGPQMFAEVRLEIARRKSLSLDAFLSLLPAT